MGLPKYWAWVTHTLNRNSSLIFFHVKLIPAEHKDGCAPLVEELEGPVVNGGGVDLKEVFEDGQARGGHAGQGRHVFLVYLS